MSDTTTVPRASGSSMMTEPTDCTQTVLAAGFLMLCAEPIWQIQAALTIENGVLTRM